MRGFQTSSVRTAGLVGLAAALAGSGCVTLYEVGVQNESRRTVEVEVLYDPLLERQQLLGSAVVRSGERVTLGSFKLDPLNPSYVAVRPTGDRLDVAERLKLEPGRREYVVEDAGVGHWHSLILREVRNAGVPPRRRPPAPWPEGPR